MPKPFFDDKEKKIQEIIRVNHAGEFGAQRIYAGQIKFTKNKEDKALLKKMLDQEIEHLEYFSSEIAEYKSRPTILLPIWNFLGFAVGALSAKAGIKTAMLVTEAVEDVIESHYDKQISYLEKHAPDNPLLDKIKKFKADETEHKNIAIKSGSKNAPLSSFLAKIIKQCCKGAIFLSKKI